MEFIVRGEGWEKKVDAPGIHSAIEILVGQGYVSKVYVASDDGKTEYRMRWDYSRFRAFPAVDDTLTAREFIEAHPLALLELAEFALDHDDEPGVGGVSELALQLASLVTAEQRPPGE